MNRFLKVAVVLTGTGVAIYAVKNPVKKYVRYFMDAFMDGVIEAIEEDDQDHALPVPGTPEWGALAKEVADRACDRFKALITEAQARKGEVVHPDDPDYVPVYASGAPLKDSGFMKENADATQQDRRPGDWCGTDRIDPDGMRTTGTGHLPPHASPYVRNAHPHRRRFADPGSSVPVGPDDEDIQDTDSSYDNRDGGAEKDSRLSTDYQANN